MFSIFSEMKRTCGLPPANICSICWRSCWSGGLAAEEGLDPVAMAGGGGISGGMLPPVAGGTARTPGEILERVRKRKQSRKTVALPLSFTSNYCYIHRGYFM